VSFPTWTVSQQESHQSDKPVRHNFSEFGEQSGVPNGVIGCREVQEDGSGLQILLIPIFYIGCQGRDLVAGTAIFAEAGLVWAEDDLDGWRNTL